MEHKMKGNFAKSKAGHDKDRIYFIINEEDEYVFLVDGKIRTISNPKRKKKKHIQIIKKYDDIKLVTDVEIKKAIKDMKIVSHSSDN